MNSPGSTQAMATNRYSAIVGKVVAIVAVAALCSFAIEKGYSVHVDVDGSTLDLKPPQLSAASCDSETRVGTSAARRRNP